MWTVYVITSIKTGRFYVGCTEDFKTRLSEHNAKKVKSTKHFAPYKLLHSETFLEKTLALKRELYLKTGRGREFIKTLV
ncbi:MAG: GIY-YIG nuclease family protein [Elusimicrobiota bacterium]|nr:GIY-YIG nuclease family protein [Elusimicrobiota bacterium]